MQLTKVVNINKYSGEYIYIGRPGLFQNPFVLPSEADRQRVLDQYTTYFLDRLRSDPSFKAAVDALQGKALGCYCIPKLCHGMIIAAYLDGELQL